jgi:hypothetical protein
METRGYTLSSLVCDLESIVSCYSEHVRERRVNTDVTRSPLGSYHTVENLAVQSSCMDIWTQIPSVCLDRQ